MKVMRTLLFGLLTAAALFPGGTSGESFGFVLSVTLWLWATVLFSNFAEAIAEGRACVEQALPALQRYI